MAARKLFGHLSKRVAMPLDCLSIGAALDQGECGMYNAGSSTSMSVLELVQTIRDVFTPTQIDIEVVRSAQNVPSSFDALCMRKTQRMWDHPPLR